MEGFAINVFGPIRVTHAFLPLLRAAEHPRIVNVSSGVGSFHRILEPGTVESEVTINSVIQNGQICRCRLSGPWS